MFVKKFEENFRFYVNYRDLNVIIVKNRYFLLLISKNLNRLNRVKIFVKFNIIVVFNRFKIKKNDEFLIAFRTRFELFEYLIVSFELCDDLVSFQSYINDALREYLNNFCIAYLDNILIYNDNKVEHEIHVKRVLTKLREVDLQINIIKCVFHVIEISYLKLIIIIKDVKMNFAKINVIIEWFTFINVKNVQSFLNFVNFYRKFIYNYNKLIFSLTRLIKKKRFISMILEMSNNIRKLEESFHFRCHLSSLQFWSQNRCWNRCFKLCVWKHIISIRRKWRISFCCLLLEKTQLNRV